MEEKEKYRFLIDSALFIKKFEGFEPKAYFDNKQYSIGYGTRANSQNEQISEKEAFARMMMHLERSVLPWIPSGIERNQKIALASFIYNVGAGNFNTSTLKKYVIEKREEGEIYDQFLRWIYVTKNGKKETSDGLLYRRRKEAELFTSSNFPQTTKNSGFLVVILFFLYIFFYIIIK